MTDINIMIMLRGNPDADPAQSMQRGDLMRPRAIDYNYGTREHRGKHTGDSSTWHGKTCILTLTDADDNELRRKAQPRKHVFDPEITLRRSHYNLDLDNLPIEVKADMMDGLATMDYAVFLTYLRTLD